MLLLFLLSFLLFVHPSHTSCSSCGAATAAGTCILASATECGTLIFYDTPVFTYDSNDGGCKTVTVKCRGQEWIYSTTRLDDGTPALSPSGDHYGNPRVTITSSDVYTCGADGTWSPSKGIFACEVLVRTPKTTTTKATTKKTTPKTTTKTTKKTTLKTTKKTTKKTTPKTTTKATTKTTTTVCKGTWSFWSDVTSCSSTCGMCGTKSQSRQCTPSRCECDGVSTQNVKCTDALCPFPAPTCCPRFVKKKDIVLKKYTCQPE